MGRAMIWDQLHGPRSLQEVLEDEFGLDLTGWDLTAATSVSGDGLTIVGYGTNPSGNREAWIATIPEPGTGSLLALRLVGLAVRRRRGVR
jgi:hypothetical protein